MTRKVTQRSPGMTRLAAARRTCVDGPELAWARRPLQHPELMAENEDLEVPGSVGSIRRSGADEETDESPDDKVEEGTAAADRTGVVRARIEVSDPHATERPAPLPACGLHARDRRPGGIGRCQSALEAQEVTRSVRRSRAEADRPSRPPGGAKSVRLPMLCDELAVGASAQLERACLRLVVDVRGGASGDPRIGSAPVSVSPTRRHDHEAVSRFAIRQPLFRSRGTHP